MQANPSKFNQFWHELKRRKVVRVITVYAAAAFVIMELVSIISDPLKLPDWTLAMVIVLLCIGFVIAVILSWIYDVTPEGIERTKSVKETREEVREKPSSLMAWKIATYLSAIVIVVLAVLHFVNRSEQSKDILDLDKSIAVLPFRNDSPDVENEYFINGTMESILDNLCKMEDLRVIARTSVETYRAAPKNITEIAKELNVSYILEGSGQKYGDKIRLMVQLINGQDGSHIWSKPYDRELEDIFIIQSEIAQLIANEIKATITPEVKERIEKIPTKNMEAYNLYLQGRYFWNQIGKDDLDRSISCFRQALEIDPDYALVYSGMAATYASYATRGFSPRKDVMFKAKEAAMKALEMDEKLGEAYAELAYARIIHDWDWNGGEKDFIRALELNPNYASAHSKFAWLHSMVGRHEEAIKESKRALELDPLSEDLGVELGRRYYFAREYDRAIEEYTTILEIYPDSERAHAHLALALSQKGLHNEALKEFSLVKNNKAWYWFYLGYIYGNAGEIPKAQEVLDHYLELSQTEFVWPVIFVFIYAGMGEADKAIEWLGKTYEQREAWLDMLRAEPMYDNLRSDPRFQDMLKRMNYPE